MLKGRVVTVVTEGATPGGAGSQRQVLLCPGMQGGLWMEDADVAPRDDARILAHVHVAVEVLEEAE